MDLRDHILSTMRQTAATLGVQMATDLADDAVLLKTGLDSLGFAILVASLEESLGYDPFVLMKEPYYPRTVGEFVGIYRDLRPGA